MSMTAWVVFCPTHQHYLVHVSPGGTTWTEDQAKAKQWASKMDSFRAAKAAEWLDHRPIAWPVSDGEAAEL